MDTEPHHSDTGSDTGPVGLLDVARFMKRDPLGDVSPLIRRVPMWKLRTLWLTCLLLGGGATWVVFMVLDGSLWHANLIAGVFTGVSLAFSLPYLCSEDHAEGSDATGALGKLYAGFWFLRR